MWVPALLLADCWEHVRGIKLLQVTRIGGFVGAKSERRSLTWEISEIWLYVAVGRSPFTPIALQGSGSK